MSATALRVGLIGWGAIGRSVGCALLRGDVERAELVGVAARTPLDAPAPQLPVDELARCCDLVVEAAGQQAVIDYADSVLDAGADLLVLSLGALVDDELLRRLTAGGPGRLFLSSGALGGVDLLTACRRLGPIRRIRLVTTKPSATLVQPWMDADARYRLERATGPHSCYAGPARTAVGLFPASVNVAAALAIAAGSWDAVEVEMVADPLATGNHHAVEVAADGGDYRFEMRHRPSSTNPRTSEIVPYAVLRAIEALTGRAGRFL